MDDFNRKFQAKYQRIPDNFRTVEEVQNELRRAGLESSNLIVGIDFTKSNEWTGKHSFGGRSLHSIGPYPNPYEQALTIIGKTLEKFDDDREIPCYGFGDATTGDHSVFNFNPGDQPCNGFTHAVSRYRQITPYMKLAGPTSFSAIVEAAVRIVEERSGQYHVLLIIADGQVTRGSHVPPGQFSPQEQATVDAIVAASNYALSIVLVGVGDGPWDSMRAFDDILPRRNFDNFQFVDFTSIMSQPVAEQQKEAMFALAALMEIPFQYRAAVELGIVGRQTGRIPPKRPLGPPPAVLAAEGRGVDGAPPGAYPYPSSTPPQGYGAAPPVHNPYPQQDPSSGKPGKPSKASKTAPGGPGYGAPPGGYGVAPAYGAPAGQAYGAPTGGAPGGYGYGAAPGTPGGYPGYPPQGGPGAPPGGAAGGYPGYPPQGGGYGSGAQPGYGGYPPAPQGGYPPAQGGYGYPPQQRR